MEQRTEEAQNTIGKENVVYQIQSGNSRLISREQSKEAFQNLHSQPEFWESLDKQLKISDIFILEMLYLPSATATFMQDIVNRLERLNLKRTAVRNRLNRLEKLGLIKLNRSSLTCVNSIPAIEIFVKKLIINCKMRFGWE